MVHKEAIPAELIREANIPKMKSIFRNMEASVFFNAKPVQQIDPKKAERKQLVTKHYDCINRDLFTEERRRF